KHFLGLRLFVRNADFAVRVVCNQMPFIRRDLFLSVSTSLSKTGDEARAALVVGVLLGIVERDDPENAILTLARSAHFAATSRVMHDHDGNLSSPQVEEPWINEFPTVGFIFLQRTRER